MEDPQGPRVGFSAPSEGAEEPAEPGWCSTEMRAPGDGAVHIEGLTPRESHRPVLINESLRAAIQAYGDLEVRYSLPCLQ